MSELLATEWRRLHPLYVSILRLFVRFLKHNYNFFFADLFCTSIFRVSWTHNLIGYLLAAEWKPLFRNGRKLINFVDTEHLQEHWVVIKKSLFEVKFAYLYLIFL